MFTFSSYRPLYCIIWIFLLVKCQEGAAGRLREQDENVHFQHAFNDTEDLGVDHIE